jgi:hypothetical protein
MTVQMENIVRPFISRPISPDFVVLPRKEVPGVVLCSLGGAGGRSVSWSTSAQGEVVTDNHRQNEVFRSSQEATVTNPDDPGQSVTFCRATTVRTIPERTATTPPRTTSYDTSGGYHDLSQGDTGSKSNLKRPNSFQETTYHYPSGNCNDSGAPGTGCAA